MRTLTSPIAVPIMQGRTEIPAYWACRPPAGLVRPPAAARVRSIRTMPLEERIQKSVDSALAGMRARIEDEVQSAITQIITAATAERDQAILAAVELARADAEVVAQHRADEAEGRFRASVDELVDKALSSERALAEENLKSERALAAENLKNERALASENLKTALQASRDELKQALAEAQQR